MAIATFMGEVVEVEQGILHPVQRKGNTSREGYNPLPRQDHPHKAGRYITDIMPPSITSPLYYLHKFAAEEYRPPLSCMENLKRTGTTPQL